MKLVSCFILLFGVCSCLGDSEEFENHYIPVLLKEGDNDDQKSDAIERPCSVQDVNCIRSYFAHNAMCIPAYGPAPDPYNMDTVTMDIAHANITSTMYHGQVKGLNNWEIKEFYINKATNKLVMEVEFDNLLLGSDTFVVSYYRKGKEPIELTGYSNIIYKSLSLTMIAPNIKNIELSKAKVFTYVSDVDPVYEMDEKLTNSKEPVVIAANKKMMENMGLSQQQSFLKLSPEFMSAFIQSTICDFQLLRSGHLY